MPASALPDRPQLRDILHAEKQLVKALPKMAKAARSGQLQRLFEVHLEETEAQAERLNECLRLLGAPARAKPCKGMMGIIDEGQEVIEEIKKKDDASADLALIGAAQRVEHYEIAGYTPRAIWRSSCTIRQSCSCSPSRSPRKRTQTSSSIRSPCP